MVSIVVINLDRDADRLRYMSDQITREGFAFTRFAAVSGANVPAPLRAYFPPEEDGSGFLSKGEIGCYASHLAVYEDIAEGRVAAPALVLEDDVELPVGLDLFLNRLLAALPADWDIVRLSSPAKRAYITVAGLDAQHALVRYSVSPGSNGAMLVSREGARKFLAREPRVMPIDQDNRELWRFNLNLYGVVPAPIRGNALATSSIDDLAAGASRENRVRQRELRKRRHLWRHHFWNIGKFGFAAWAASELANIPVQLTPKRKRADVLKRTGKWLASFAKKAS